MKLLGGRGASAVMGILMLALGSSEASAQGASAINVPAAIRSADVDSTAKPFGTALQAATASAVHAVATTTAVTTASGLVLQAQPAQTVNVQFSSSIAREASWLRQAGWPLYALVDRFATNAPLDVQTNCLATAVYFEARGEAVEGQLAVARVVMNRAASGKYPTSWCEVVKQPAQFSFVRHGEFPQADTNCDAWRKAEAVAQLAAANVVPSLSTDVLWYHANYVAPSWGRRLSFAQKIGQHIFYRS